MMKKIIGIILLVLAIPAIFIGYKIVHMYNFISSTKGNGSAKAEAYVQDRIDDNNVPDYAKGLMFVQDNKPKSKVDVYDFSHKEWYDAEVINEVLQNIKDLPVPSLEKYPEVMTSNLKDKIGKCKSKNELVSFEESENQPAKPSRKLMRASLRNWCRTSIYYSMNKDPETALLIAYAILDFSQRLNLDYYKCYAMIEQSINGAYIKIAYPAIMVCISKPLTANVALTKAMAKDILVMAANDSKKSIDLICKYEVYALEKMLMLMGDNGKNIIGKLLETKEFKDTIKAYNNILKQCEDRSNTEIVADSSISSAYNKYAAKYTPYESILKTFWNPEQAVTNIMVSMGLPPIPKIAETKEAKLATLEFYAVALAINSYVSDKKMLPKSISEVEKWFGQSLPLNRYTNEAYEIEREAEYISVKYTTGSSYKQETEFRLYYK